MAKGRKKYIKLGDALIEERRKRGITQKLVAEKLKCEPSRLARIEQGTQRIDVIQFLDLARVVGFDPASFITTLQSD